VHGDGGTLALGRCPAVKQRGQFRGQLLEFPWIAAIRFMTCRAALAGAHWRVRWMISTLL
jgi:hypothetical protein